MPISVDSSLRITDAKGKIITAPGEAEINFQGENFIASSQNGITVDLHPDSGTLFIQAETIEPKLTGIKGWIQRRRFGKGKER